MKMFVGVFEIEVVNFYNVGILSRAAMEVLLAQIAA